MIKKEWQRLIHNPLLIIVLAAIILIPSIYAGLFLASMWDPYGELDKLPVAVVNKDVPVVYEGETINIGVKRAYHANSGNIIAMINHIFNRALIAAAF